MSLVDFVSLSNTNEHVPSHVVLLLLGIVGTCIAPATLALTVILIAIQSLYRALHTVASRAGVVSPAQKQI